MKKATSVPAFRHVAVENHFCSDPLQRAPTRISIEGCDSANSTVDLDSARSVVSLEKMARARLQTKTSFDQYLKTGLLIIESSKS